MTRLDNVDLSLHLSKAESEQRVDQLQRRLLHLRLMSAGLLDAGHTGPALCVIFEGWDASGKGGSIKRLVARLDPRHVTVSQFGVPTEEERRRHFLWRFWRSLPGQGEMSIYDRSWYGRVLVERVEGLITPEAWERAYEEIVDFEKAMVEEDMVLVKFWLHISPAEQLKRFESRASDPLRQWKLTEDDWRNRSMRELYEPAVEEMFDRTDHQKARWNIISGENKHYARVKILETVVEHFEKGLQRSGIELPHSLGADYDPSN